MHLAQIAFRNSLKKNVFNGETAIRFGYYNSKPEALADTRQRIAKAKAILASLAA
jgi:hypothetical protein